MHVANATSKTNTLCRYVFIQPTQVDIMDKSNSPDEFIIKSFLPEHSVIRYYYYYYYYYSYR